MLTSLKVQLPAILQALGEHIFLSLVALTVALLIALPLAIVLRHKPKIANFCLNIANIFQTIPSLALLGLLIPIVGIGFKPAIIALVLYAVMPIFQNTYTGLTNINAEYNESIMALGLSRKTSLFKIELPLAMPMILSGVKIAMVMIIGTATLAALVGAGGLGTFILLGIETNNNKELLIGAVLAAILALTFSIIINGLAKKKFRKWSFFILVILLLFSLIFGLQNNNFNNKQTITIAGKLGAEPAILINMYKDLIENDHPDVQVNLKPNFGNTMFLFNALRTKQIDIYPEFTGTVIESLLSERPNSHSKEKIYKLAKEGLAKKYHLTYLAPMKYENNYALAVNSDFAKQYNLKTISDTKVMAKQIKAGFSTDFANSQAGYLGLQRMYNLNYSQVKTMDPSLCYAALHDKKVNLIDVYTTDAEIKEYRLQVLTDDKHFFPPYQGAPLMTEQFADEHPEVVKSLNKLKNKITTKEMQKMNYQVVVKHQKAQKVAREYLKQKRLIK